MTEPKKGSAQKTPEGWKEKGGSLYRRFILKDFAQALDFVVRIGKLAERSAHHPSITLSYGRVEVRLKTHSKGRITGKDTSLAKKINALR